MPFYRKKPVVIEAMQNVFGRAVLISDWLGRSGEGTLWKFNENKGTFEISTLEGTMVADRNDYIIKGVKGEFYPCKPDIFEQTYEGIN